MPGMLTDAQYRFLETSRVGRLATADAKGVPHLVPVCYAVMGDSAYITVDEKPKRTDIPLKRIRNILENPAVALTVDRWDEDWSRLAWVMLRGQAEVLEAGDAAAGPRAARVIDRLMEVFLGRPVAGGWIDHVDAAGAPLVDFMPASTLYHVFLAVAEADRVWGAEKP